MGERVTAGPADFTEDPRLPAPGPRPRLRAVALERCGGCGHVFGSRVATYRQDGAWLVLQQLETPAGAFVWDLSITCPDCGAPFYFHARRRR